MTESPIQVSIDVADAQAAVTETYATHTDSPWRANMSQALAPPLPPAPTSGVAVNSLGYRFVRVSTRGGPGGVWRHMAGNGLLGATYTSWEDLVLKEPSVIGLIQP